MSRAQMNTNKRRGTAQMHSTPSFTYVADEGWHRATERYSEFLRRHEGQRILFLELGVGYNTPVLRSLSTRRKLRKNMVKQQIQGYLFNKSTKYGERRCA